CMTAYVWSTPSRDLPACRLARYVNTPIITMIAAPPYVATIRCRFVSFGVERLPMSCLFGLEAPASRATGKLWARTGSCQRSLPDGCAADCPIPSALVIFRRSRHPPAPALGVPMSISRRDFVRSASAAAALSAIGNRADALATAPTIFVPEHASIADFRELAMKALDAAKAAGAEYADVRIAQYRSQTVQTRERRVQGLADTETAGIGVRTLVSGGWGFAATADLSADSVTAVARKAVAQAKANRAALTKPIVLAPYGTAQKGTWRSPIKTDPFSIPIADNVPLLLAANEAALTAKGSR